LGGGRGSGEDRREEGGKKKGGGSKIRLEEKRTVENQIEEEKFFPPTYNHAGKTHQRKVNRGTRGKGLINWCVTTWGRGGQNNCEDRGETRPTEGKAGGKRK